MFSLRTSFSVMAGAALVLAAPSCLAKPAHHPKPAHHAKPAHRTTAPKPDAAATPAPLADSTADVPLGVNLEGLADYMRTPMFADAMKTSRRFGSPDHPWDGVAPTDALGNPTQDAGVVVISGLPHMGGAYHFSCTGKTAIAPVASKASVSDWHYDPAQNRTTATVQVGDDADQLMLAFTHTQGGIQNIHLMRPCYALGDKTLFTKEFLAALAPFSTLRLMDYLDTNDTKVARWADRPTPANAQLTLGKGGDLEDAIALANATGKDLWINIPDLADDDYVRREAELFHSTLAPGCHVYLEYSNEVWNWAFGQSHRNQDAAEQEAKNPQSPLHVVTGVQWDDANNKYYWGYKRVSEQLLRIAKIFAGVYGPGALGTTIRPVYASWVIMPKSRFVDVLAWVNTTYGPPKQFFYAITGAAYFNVQKAPKNASVTELLDAMRQDSDNNLQWRTAIGAIAKQYGVRHAQYEVGPDVGGGSTENVANRILANRDARMTGIILHDARDNWFARGGDLYMYFAFCDSYSRYGAWGLSETVDDVTTPKWQAIDALTARLPLPAPPQRNP